VATIGKVRAVFTASTSGLTSGVNAASASMRKLQSDVKGMRSSLSMLTAINGAQLFGSIASGASQAVRSLVGIGQASAETIDSTSKLAARLGMTYGELAGLAYAGDLAGVGMDTIANAATKADVAFVKAAGGSKEAAAKFAAIGLSVDKLSGMTASERFDAIAQAISTLPSEAQKAAAAVSIFGKAGAQLLPLFAGGAAGIQAARAEADKFGMALTNMQGQNVEAMNDAFTRAQKAVGGVIDQVVAYLAPAIQNVTDGLTALIASTGGKNLGQLIGEGILAAAQSFAFVADSFIAGAKVVWDYASSIGAIWEAVWNVGEGVASYLQGVAQFWKSIFQGVAAIIAGVVGKALEGVGRVARLIPGFGDTGSAIQSAGESMQGSAAGLLKSAQDSMKGAGESFRNAIGLGGEEAGQNSVGPISEAFAKGAETARDAFSKIDFAAPTTIPQVDGKQAAAEIASVTSKGINVDGRQAAAQIQAAANKEGIKGMDVRSAEGMKEMMRLMRDGGRQDLQRELLTVNKEIARNTANTGFDLEVADFAPAAGA
jgi:hypothetical protein